MGVDMKCISFRHLTHFLSFIFLKSGTFAASRDLSFTQLSYETQLTSGIKGIPVRELSNILSFIFIIFRTVAAFRDLWFTTVVLWVAKGFRYEVYTKYNLPLLPFVIQSTSEIFEFSRDLRFFTIGLWNANGFRYKRVSFGILCMLEIWIPL